MVMKKYIGTVMIAYVLLVASQAQAASVNDALLDLLIEQFIAHLLDTGVLTQTQVDFILAAGDNNNQALVQENDNQEGVDAFFEEDPEEKIVAAYDVINGQLRERNGEVGNVVDQDVWEIFVQVAGKEFVKENVVEYLIFDDEDNDTEAYVQASDESNGSWRYAINRAVLDENRPESEKYETIVHEFSHIFSFNADQVDDSIDYEDCETAYTAEGCPNEDSYYQMFIDEFWSARDLRGVEDEDEEDAQDYAYEIYDADPEDYPSEYAATNPGEDFAETFAFFVMRPKPDSTVDGYKKMLWMYEQDDLAELREDILERTGK